MTAKQSSREEMTGWLDDSEIDPEMICAILSTVVFPCLLLSPWFFRGAGITRCRASYKLQGNHLNLKCETLQIENLLFMPLFTAGIAMQCIVCSEFCLVHILESPGIVCRGYTGHTP